MSSLHSTEHLSHEPHWSDRLADAAIHAAESGWIPDRALRLGIREICRRRLRQIGDDPERRLEDTLSLWSQMRRSPIALVPDAANAQHYEVTAAFYNTCLGPHKKYSSCYWDASTHTLADAEEKSLELTCEHAMLEDGQEVLELGCGWGSLSLWMAENYPGSKITSVSNSASQRHYIMDQAERRKLDNLEVVTCDMNDFEIDRSFDRVVSVEMFEHMRNHERLLEKVASWLRPDGKVLIHVFCAADSAYALEDEGKDDWMARNFFTGGIMPSDDLFLRHQKHLIIDRQWRWSGVHYQKTADAWLENLDANAAAAESALVEAGEPDPRRAVNRWRMFFMACSELFGYDHGRRWWVSHYRFTKR
jgi:cyclopropane-fatty-acyl-phospholipid synthase